MSPSHCPQWHYLELRPGTFVAPIDLCELEAYGLHEPDGLALLLAGLALLALLERVTARRA